MPLSDRMRSVRINKGISQNDLAEKAGVSRVSIGFYERGERIPPADVAAKIADALDIPVSFLLSNVDLVEADADERFLTVYETLESAGFTIEQDEKDAAHAEWRISNDEYNIAVAVDESRLMQIVEGVLTDADLHREEYIKRRLIAEFQ